MSVVVKTQLKSFLLFTVFNIKSSFIRVMNILWKCNIDIFNIDWVMPSQVKNVHFHNILIVLYICAHTEMRYPKIAQFEYT